ncbi:MAG: 4-hydroxy-tetrahydrodipicolinate synthase [Hyphomonadaceae bacterium]|nr:4-hydroxy-tetrahydrodipicolinate synthase [Hyphomonadaceae bacterium]
MFHGSIPALITPFKNGAIDRDAFADLIERQISGGSAALVPCGTTGESATLSHDEHREVVELCIQIAGGRVPVIAGAGSNSTREAIELVDHAKTVGADAALVICPYYNKPDQAGLEAHFRAINDAVSIPVILYNVPSRTACDLLPETVAALARLPNIVGIKDASNDLGRVSLQAALTDGEQFTQLSGEDPSSLGHRAMGGAGCISVTANIAPDLCAQMHKAFDDGDLATAQALDQRLIHLHKAMFFSPSPGPAKYVLNKMGVCSDEVRLPIVGPDAETRAAIDSALVAAGRS